MDEEVWKDVVGWEGYYEVSNLGRVRSCPREVKYINGRVYSYPGKTLRPFKDSYGYLRVMLSRNQKMKNSQVHRLVLIAFEGEGDKPQVNHIDGDKENNKIENLEWCTSSENQRHAYLTGLKTGVRGERSHHSKLSEIDVRFIKHWLDSGYKQRDIAKAFGVHFATISCISRGKSWSHL